MMTHRDRHCVVQIFTLLIGGGFGGKLIAIREDLSVCEEAIGVWGKIKGIWEFINDFLWNEALIMRVDLVKLVEIN